MLHADGEQNPSATYNISSSYKCCLPFFLCWSPLFYILYRYVFSPAFSGARFIRQICFSVRIGCLLSCLMLIGCQRPDVQPARKLLRSR